MRRYVIGMVIVASTLLVGAARGYAWQVALDGVGKARSDVWESVAFHPSGDVLVAGQSYQYDDNETDCTVVLARLARADGAVLWRQERHIRRTLCFRVTRLLVDGNGDLVVERGSTLSKRSGATGELLWATALGRFPYDGPEVQASALDAAGNVLFTGGFGKDPDRTDLVVGKIDGATGAVAWRKSFSGTSLNRGYNLGAAVAADGGGDVIVLGELVDYVGTGDDVFRESHGVALKLAGADGSELWRVASDRSPQVSGNVELVIDAAGNPLQLAQAGTVVKRSGQTGAELWRYHAPSPSSFGPPSGSGIALGSDGDVYATWQWFGGSLGSSGGSSALVARIDGTNGAERWHAEVASGELLSNVPAGLAVDAAGNALLAVRSESTADHFDFLVVELAAADGAEVWRFDVDGPDASSKFPSWSNAVAVDGDRAVAVGNLVGGGQDSDGVAVVLTADGTESWRNTLHRNDASADQALALAVLASGDVVAAGKTTRAQGQSSFVVHRFASSDGNVAWTRDLGPGKATALVADVAGDVIAGGNLYLPEGSPMVVAKLAGDDGSERWRFAPPRSLAEFLAPIAVALAPNGDVFAAILQQGKAGPVRVIAYRLAAADGSVLWRRKLANGRVVSLLVDSQANVLLGMRSDGSQSRLRLVKLAGGTGAKQWIKRLAMWGFNAGLALTPADDAAVIGQSVEQLVFMLDGTTGQERWRHSLGELFDGHVAVTPAGDVLAAAASGLGDRTTVVKIDGATGARSWGRELDVFVEGLGCSPTSLVSGANGDALLAGCDLDNFAGVPFDVLALAAANGALRWHRSLDGPRTPASFGSHDDDLGPAVGALAPDPFGNVVAVGSTDDGTHGLDFTVVKWGADGSDILAVPGPG